ncbi:hypothetical protein B5G00_12250 [Blautia sp. An46]|nr:hypothetical protein B5G33_20385 [Blautia sp. An81]OUN91569.1 hypothetical protein B5G00_12250 [Blautia sp. An46]
MYFLGDLGGNGPFQAGAVLPNTLRKLGYRVDIYLSASEILCEKPGSCTQNCQSPCSDHDYLFLYFHNFLPIIPGNCLPLL